MVHVGQTLAGREKRRGCILHPVKESLRDRIGFARPRLVTAAAVACAYWVSQVAVTYFVSDAVMSRGDLWHGAALCFGVFGALLVVHLLKPFSRMAAIFGLLAFAVYVILIWHMVIPGRFHGLIWDTHANTGMLIATILGVSGVLLDVNRCLHLGRIGRIPKVPKSSAP